MDTSAPDPYNLVHSVRRKQPSHMASEQVQRRLAAVLAADVVGYSRLIGADEAGTRARFNRVLEDIVGPAIGAHRGRLVKTMGDGMLIEFASVIDAVQCAADIQVQNEAAEAKSPKAERISLRIGIHLGDVIVEGDDIHGDGVNIAARLEGVAEPGGICVSDMVHAGVRNKLALDFDDDGEHSLKNIAEPVRVYRAVLRRRERQALPESDALFRRPAVAVLPFENLSRDPDDEYFADGLTEDLITALSLWRTFPVIARNSTFSYKGTSPDIRRVGEELGARYVIEGSVRRAGDRARIAAQLINTETGHHVWAERFDRDIKDIFALQDELSLRITATVAPELERTEQRRLSRFDAPDLDAWGYVQRGWLLVDQFTKESVAAARECFERAVSIDPSYCQAHVGVSRSHFVDYRWGFSDDIEHTRSAMMESARKAVDLDNQEARAHWVLGTAYRARQQYDMAIFELVHALGLNPSLYFARFALGACHFDLGRPTEGIPHIQNAIQLNPRDPRNFAPYMLLSAVCLDVHDYAEAEKWAGNAIGLKTDLADAYIILASSLGHQGRFTEAATAYGEYSRLREDRGAQPYIRVVVQIDQEHFQDGLRKAGLVD